MPAPFPYEAVAGAANDGAESEAKNLRADFAWLARLAHEMNAETVLDLKRTAQIVLHCRKFRQWYAALQARVGQTHTAGELADVIEGHFAARRTRWPTRAAMLADLAAINDDAGTIADWIEANAPEYKDGFATLKIANAQGDMTDEPIKAAKPAALATRIANFRARWA